MVKINETYYELDIIDIVKELREQLLLKGLNLFSKIKELPEDIMVSCPFHKEGQEKKPSCGIRKSDGWVHCFTCNESCSLEQMISRCFGVNDFGQYGLNWLKTNFLGDILANRKFYIDLQRNPIKTNPNNNYIEEKELDSYRFYHPYMFQRKMNAKVIDIFDIGYDSKTDCITFPVRDKNGKCLFVARRSVKTKYFNYPNNAEKPVYGIYELYHLKHFPNDIYICESMIDAIYLWTFNKFAVALNGLGTEHQFEQLRGLPCRHYILATDNDESGYKARKRLKENIYNKLITEVELPYNRKDINDCSSDEIKNLKEIF